MKRVLVLSLVVFAMIMISGCASLGVGNKPLTSPPGMDDRFPKVDPFPSETVNHQFKSVSLDMDISWKFGVIMPNGQWWATDINSLLELTSSNARNVEFRTHYKYTGEKVFKLYLVLVPPDLNKIKLDAGEINPTGANPTTGNPYMMPLLVGPKPKQYNNIPYGVEFQVYLRIEDPSGNFVDIGPGRFIKR